MFNWKNLGNQEDSRWSGTRKQGSSSDSRSTHKNSDDVFMCEEGWEKDIKSLLSNWQLDPPKFDTGDETSTATDLNCFREGRTTSRLSEWTGELRQKTRVWSTSSDASDCAGYAIDDNMSTRSSLSPVSVSSGESVSASLRNMGVKAIMDCQQALLDIQGDLKAYYGQMKLSFDVMVAIAPDTFSKAEVTNLLELDSYQCHALQTLVDLRVTQLADPGYSVRDATWSALDITNSQRYTSLKQENRPVLAAAVFTSNTKVFGCFRHLHSVMNTWKSSHELIENNLRETYGELDDGILQDPQYVLLKALLEHLKKSIEDARTSVWALFSTSDGNEMPIMDAHGSTRLQSLPYRAEDPVVLPRLRFPPSRKQKGAPRYENKNRKR